MIINFISNLHIFIMYNITYPITYPIMYSNRTKASHTDSTAPDVVSGALHLQSSI